MRIIYDKCTISCSGCDDQHQLESDLDEDDATEAIDEFRERHQACPGQERLPGLVQKGGKK